jgi:hypothetical protein
MVNHHRDPAPETILADSCRHREFGRKGTALGIECGKHLIFGDSHFGLLSVYFVG